MFRPQTFSVLMHDAYGNPVAAERPGVAITAVFTSADDPADSFTAAVAWNTKLGRYNAEYSAEIPGLYYANLTLDAGDGRGPNALALPSSYVGTVIEAESVETQKCEVSGAGVGSDPIGAGTPASFTVRARDKYGSRIPRGGAVFHALARGRNGTSAEGTTVRLDSLVGRGRRNVHGYVHADKGGRLLALGSPRRRGAHGGGLPVQRDRGSRRHVGGAVEGVRRRTVRRVSAGRLATFRVQAYDAFGNKKTDSHDEFRFSVRGVDHPTPMTAVGGGVYEGSYVVDDPGPSSCPSATAASPSAAAGAATARAAPSSRDRPYRSRYAGRVPPTATSFEPARSTR